MDDILGDFIVEANESLDQIDQALILFEADPGDKAALAGIFRLFHTLKGTAGFMGLPRLETVAHAAETLLGRFRDGALSPSSDSIDLIMAAVDAIKVILGGLETRGLEPDTDHRKLISHLEDVAMGVALVDVAAPARTGEGETSLRPGEVSEDELERAFAAAAFDPSPAIPAFVSAEPAAPALRPGEVSEDELERAFAEAPILAPSFIDAPTLAEEPATPPAPRQEAAGAVAPTVNTSVRVGLDVLENMMTLVSELVLTRNQLLQVNRQREDGAFSSPLQRLSTITGELQETVTKTRMQPIGASWNKLPRLVRELSRDLGKKIDLRLEGEATEVDRQVLELIRDPLTHMVRNSADHGLETEAERLAAGKSATGVITLSAYPEGGSIVIRLSDDGRGLDGRRIRAKAVEQGLLTAAEAESISDAQAYRLIFSPGFSTAQAVTSVSGRGVGMDVVMTNLEQIGGQVEITSRPGEGATFTVKIPLTLAIMATLIVDVAGQRFALPQSGVLELVRFGPGSPHRIETIESLRMLRLRSQLLPVLDLAPTLRLGEERRTSGYVAVVAVGQRRFGVLVDRVIDTEEIVVKPLAQVLRKVNVFSGATILGDGSVVLILDPNELAGQMGEASVRAESFTDAASLVEIAAEKSALLIFTAGDRSRKAVELSKVTRLERPASSAIETLNGRAILQYRGKLTPILPVVQGQSIGAKTVQPLLILSGALYSMGIAVDEIIDVVEDHLDITLVTDRPGVKGAAVVGGKATEILDVDHYLVLGLAIQSQLGRADEAAKERTVAA